MSSPWIINVSLAEGFRVTQNQWRAALKNSTIAIQIYPPAKKYPMISPGFSICKLRLEFGRQLIIQFIFFVKKKIKKVSQPGLVTCLRKKKVEPGQDWWTVLMQCVFQIRHVMYMINLFLPELISKIRIFFLAQWFFRLKVGLRLQASREKRKHDETSRNKEALRKLPIKIMIHDWLYG